MDKFFIREIVAIWAFNQQNEAVWKCSNISKLKITQDGTTIRKKDAQGETIFKLNTSKSANISFECNYWDFNILSMLSGSEMRELDNTQNPYSTKPINIPYTQTFKIEAVDVSRGYITLDKLPRRNEYYYYEIAVHKIGKGDSILTPYQQGSYADTTHFYVDGSKIMLPTSVGVGDTIETVYEYESYSGTELINSANNTPETWKVKILMLVSPICNIDVVSAVWITAKNATPEASFSLDVNVEDNVPVSLELGYSICDSSKELYEIVAAGAAVEGTELRTNDNQILYTHDQEAVSTLQ